MATNRIHSKGAYEHEEYKANSTLIYPGYLLALDTNGEVAPHAVQGGIAEALFAEEDALQGNPVSTIYDDDAIVSCILPHKSCAIRAMIQVDEDIDIGDFLMSNGNGKLVLHAALDSAAARYGSDEYPIAVAMEACDLTASGAVDTLCQVRIL